MPDFVCSSDALQMDGLVADLQRVTASLERTVKSSQGLWGAIAVLQDPKCDCSMYEDDKVIVVLCGSPIIPAKFHSPPGARFPQATIHADRALAAWKAESAKEAINLRGPFCLLQIDKSASRISVTTDHLSFIPVYVNLRADRLVLSTHPDIAAQTTGRHGLLRLDPVAELAASSHHTGI